MSGKHPWLSAAEGTKDRIQAKMHARQHPLHCSLSLWPRSAIFVNVKDNAFSWKGNITARLTAAQKMSSPCSKLKGCKMVRTERENEWGCCAGLQRWWPSEE